jgi:outer membrane protein OmpA-like peptidoglycan-associated protein
MSPKNNHFYSLSRSLAAVLTVFTFLFASTHSIGQIKKGKRLYEEGRYTEAIKPLKKDFNSGASVEAGILLSKCYYQILEYQEALDVMSIIGPEKLESADDRRFYADVLIANDDFSSAYLELVTLLSEDQSDTKSYLWLEKVSELLEWDTIRTNSDVMGVRGINTVYNEYCPYISASGEIWFISDVTNIQTIFPNSYNNQNMHLYFSTTFRNEEGTEAKRPNWLVKRKDYYYHDGPLDDWPGEDKYALTLRDLDAPLNSGVVGIYFSTLSGDENDIIPFKFNENYNTGHPTFKDGGRTMIFASDRPGGYGEMDLWYCTWSGSAWSEPKNMGPVINTPFNEVFPNFHNSRLYFSSDRIDKGYGGLDLYYSGELNGFSELYNLRSPINSAYDDFGLTFGKGRLGYFSSNRPGGSGGDDIYSFIFVPEQKTVPSARLRIIDAEIAAGTSYEILDHTGMVVASGTTLEGGVIGVDELVTRELYILKVSGDRLPKEAKLITLNAAGETIDVFQQNGKNQFAFELLPTEDYLLDKMDEDDDSKLQIDINGRIVAAENTNVDDVPVSLKDGTGAVLATVKTVDGGKFRIEGVESREDYTFETEGLDEYHEIDVFGKSGAIVQSLKPMGSNSFAYTREAPKALWMTTTEIKVPTVYGIILNNETVPGENVVLYDENDAELRKPVIDEDGFIDFGSLIAGKAYRLYLPERTLAMQDRLVILDAKGDTSQTVRPFDEENYFFEYLLYRDYGSPEMETIPVATAPVDVEVGKTLRARISPYDLNGVQKFIFKNASVADTVYANERGVLVLKNVDLDSDYSLELLNGQFPEETSITVYDENNQEILKRTSKDLKSFNLDFLSAKDYSLAQIENEDDSSLGLNLSGRVLTSNPANSKITARDAQGVILGTAVADEKGFFAMFDIKSSDEVSFEVEGEDEKMRLELFNPEDGRISTISRGANGAFVASMKSTPSKSIPEDSYSAQVEDFKPKLPRAFELLDENGSVIDTVYSNVNGRIELKGIERGKSYSVRLLEGLFEVDKEIRIYDRDGNIVYEGRSRNFKTFASVLLEEKDFSLEKQENEDTSLLSLSLLGRVENENEEAVEVNVYDKEMEFLAQTYTDRNGRFSVEGLPADTTYVFKIVSEFGTDGMYVLNPLTGDSAYVAPSENGNYYLNLNPAGEDMLTIVEKDKKVSVKSGARFDLPEVYYRFNSFTLEETAKQSIDRLVRILKDNPEIQIEISSHTDSRGPANYNKLLSTKRAQSVVDYLVSKGIDKSRLIAIGKGETELTNQCSDGVRCSNAEHARNRRTEFRIIRSNSQ